MIIDFDRRNINEKKVITILFAIFIILFLNACKKGPTSDNVEVNAYQRFSDDPTGIIKAELLVKWENGKVSLVYHKDTYVTEEVAKNMYYGPYQVFKDRVDSNLVIKGNVITYKEDLSEWEDVSYDKFVESLENDGQWTIEK